MELKGIKYKIFNDLKYIMTARVRGEDGKMYQEYKSVKIDTPSVVYIDEQTDEMVTGTTEAALRAQFLIDDSDITTTGVRDERGAFLR